VPHAEISEEQAKQHNPFLLSEQYSSGFFGGFRDTASRIRPASMFFMGN
jgi:hypothetical protein